MTIGALTVGAGVIAFTVVTGGAGAALVGTAVPLAVEIAGTVGTATGVVSATTAAGATAVAAGGAAAAAGTGAVGAVTGTATTAAFGAGMSAGAIEAGFLGASVLGPAGALIACFKNDTKVEKIDGSVISVADLAVGDEVKSRLDPHDKSSEGFSKVTNVTILEGSFPAHELHFHNGTVLTATSPHYMVIYRQGQAQVIPACKVRVGDVMSFKRGEFVSVSTVKDVQLARKVNVEVEGGLIYVNGVLATGVCELGPREAFEADKFLAEYRATHSYMGTAITVSA